MRKLEAPGHEPQFWPFARYNLNLIVDSGLVKYIITAFRSIFRALNMDDIVLYVAKGVVYQQVEITVYRQR